MTRQALAPRTRRAGACLWILLAAGHLGCSSPPPATHSPAHPQAADEPLHDGPLTDYVPAAGLRWMVIGRLRHLARSADFAETIGPLFPSHRLDAYAASTGIDLRNTPNALVAGFDYGTLYVAETTDENRRVERLFSRRLSREPVVSFPHQRLRRMVGVVGNSPQALVSIRGQLVAIADRDTTLARIVEAFARGQLRDSPSALDGASLSALPAELHRAPLRFYAPGPFTGEWLAGVRGLLAATTAVGIAAYPREKKRVQVRLVLGGDWQGPGEDSALRLAEAWRDLAESSTGRLLGLHRPAAAPAIDASGDQLRLEVVLEIPPIVAGLRAAVMADVWEILDFAPPEDNEPSSVQTP